MCEENTSTTSQENHKSFLNRFRLKITPADLKKLDFAYVMAKYGHGKQIRDCGVRYFEHLRSTSLILIDELGITDVEIIIASLLHDMLEDNFLLDVERINFTFGERVAMIVNTVSKPRKNDLRFSSDEQRNACYFEQIANSETCCKIVKLADRLHNVRTLSSCQEEKQRRKVKETKIVYLPLIEKISEEYPEVAQFFRQQFQIAITELEQNLNG